MIRDVVELFGLNFQVTLETVFSTVEHMERMLRTVGDKRAYKADDLRRFRERLVQSIAAVFEEALTEHGKGRTHLECEHHKRFVRNILQPKDTIITFNYDCLLDDALRDHGADKWNPRYGYALPLGRGTKKLRGDTYWMPDSPADRDTTVTVLKLHGSLHFWVQKDRRAKGVRIALKQRPYTKQKGNLRFTIIPPEWNKHFDEQPFRRLWKTASMALQHTENVVLIGYSMPATDLHAASLFRASLGRGKLRSLTIVNPDREARYRTRALFSRGMDAGTKVSVFDSLKEFVNVPREVWEPQLP